jgi:hypothetical protein
MLMMKCEVGPTRTDKDFDKTQFQKTTEDMTCLKVKTNVFLLHTWKCNTVQGIET